MGINKKWSKLDRDQVVLLRDSGTSWPKIAKATGIPRSTCISIFQRESRVIKEPEPEPVEPPKDEIEEAFVLKHVPNPRLMLIGFPGREGFARCVKRPEDNRRINSQLLVRRVEDDLFRLV